MIDNAPRMSTRPVQSANSTRSETTCQHESQAHLECGGCQAALCPQDWDQHTCSRFTAPPMDEPIVTFRLLPPMLLDHLIKEAVATNDTSADS